MKKLIGLFLLLIFCVGCEKGGEEPELPYDYAEFWGYHVKDTAGFQIETIKSIYSNDTTWLFGMKKGKPWFGMFNEKTKEQIDEWLCTTTYSFNNQTTIPFKPFKISNEFIFFMEYPTGKSENTVDYFTCEPFLLRENKAILLNSYNNIAWGNDRQFSTRMLDDNILIYHPYNHGYIYSKEGEELVNTVVINDTQIDNNDFMSGFKRGKAWLGIYKDNKLIQEYIDDEVYDRNKKIYKGYGEYEDYYVKEFLFGRLLKTNWGYVFAPNVTYSDPFYITLDLFICKDGKMKRIDAPSSNFDLYNWYDNSFLVYEYSIVYTIYSPNGKLILHQKKTPNTSVDPFRTGNTIPISLTEYIWNDYWGWGNGTASLRIRRYNLNSYASYPIWQQTIATISSNSKVTWNLLDRQSEIWLYLIDILNYDGSKEQIQFSININTGDLKIQ